MQNQSNPVNENTVSPITVNSSHPIGAYLIGMLHDDIYSKPQINANNRPPLVAPEYIRQAIGGQKAYLRFSDLFISDLPSGYYNLECTVEVQDDGVIKMTTNIYNVDGELRICYINYNGTEHIAPFQEVTTQEMLPIHFPKLTPNQPATIAAPIDDIPNLPISSSIYTLAVKLIENCTHAQGVFRYRPIPYLMLVEPKLSSWIEKWAIEHPTPTILDLMGVKYVTVAEFKTDEIQYVHQGVEYGVIVSLTWHYEHYGVKITPYDASGRLTPKIVVTPQSDGTLKYHLPTDPSTFTAPKPETLPEHLVFNPVTNSYYKYEKGGEPGALVTLIDIEVNPHSSKILRGWTLEELEAIVNHLKEQK